MPRAPQDGGGADGGGWFEAARYLAVGVELVACVVVGLGIGVWLDRRLETAPWLTLLGAASGSAAGIRLLLVAGRRWQRNDERAGRPDGRPGP